MWLLRIYPKELMAALGFSLPLEPHFRSVDNWEGRSSKFIKNKLKWISSMSIKYFRANTRIDDIKKIKIKWHHMSIDTLHGPLLVLQMK